MCVHPVPSFLFNMTYTYTPLRLILYRGTNTIIGSTEGGRLMSKKKRKLSEADDLTGMRFDRLVAVRCVGRVGKEHRWTWEGDVS